jgi:hypothetical protein
MPKGGANTLLEKQLAAYNLAIGHGWTYAAIGRKFRRCPETIKTWVETAQAEMGTFVNREQIKRELAKLIPAAVEGLRFHVENTDSRDNYNACVRVLEAHNLLTKAAEGDDDYRAKSDAELIRDIVDTVTDLAKASAPKGDGGDQPSSS